MKTIKVKEKKGGVGENTTITTTRSMLNSGILFKLEEVWFYPSNNSLGPIPLSVAYVTDPNYKDYLGGIELLGHSTSSSGIKISFGVTFFGGISHLDIIGTSITTSTSSMELNTYSYFGTNYGADSQFAEIYTEGQIAVANYTEYYSS